MPQTLWVIAILVLLPAAAGAQDSSTQPATAPTKSAALQTLTELTPAVAVPEHKPLPSLPVQARDLLAQAQDRLKSGDVSGAVDRLEKAVGYAPADPQLRRELAEAYLRLKDLAKARQNLLRAVAVAPDDLTSLVLLARVSADSGDVPGAVVYLRTALKCPDAKGADPQAAIALYRLGGHLADLGYYTAADDCYRQLGDRLNAHGGHYGRDRILMRLVTAPESLLVLRGGLRTQMGHHAQAADFFQRAYARNRSDVSVAHALIDALIRSGSFDKAEGLVVGMLREPSQRRGVAGMVERLCTAAQDPAMIGRIWKAYDSAEAADVGLALALATSADRVGANAQAAAIARSVLKLSPTNAAALRVLIRSTVAVQKTDSILPTLADMIVSDPRTASATAAATAELASLKVDGELDRAWARAAMADRSGRKAPMHLVAGQLAVAMDRRLLAIDQFRRAIDADKSFVPAYSALVEAYLSEKEFDKAQRLLDRLETVAGDSASYHCVRGRLLRAKGEDEEALGALLKALESEPGNAETLLEIADAYAATGKPREAQMYLMRALQADPDNVSLYRKLFDMLMASRSDSVRIRARAIARQLLGRHPGNVIGRLMLIEYDLQRAGNNTQRRLGALAQLAQLRKQAPGDIDVALVELEARIGTGEQPLPEDEFNRLAAQLGEVLRVVPRNVRARQMLGGLMLRQGKVADAMAIWQQLFRDRPDDRGIAERFVRSAMQAQRYDLARSALEHMISRHGPLLWPRMTLVRVLVEVKDYARAAREAQRFLAQAPTDEGKEFFRLSLLQIYKQTQQYAKAHHVLDEWQLTGAEGFRLRLIRQSRVELFCKQKQFDHAIASARTWMENSDEPDTVRATLILTLNDHEAYHRSHTLIDRWLKEGSLQSPVLFKSLKISTFGSQKAYDAAVEYVQAWLKDQPWLQRPRELTIGILVHDKQYDKALPVLHRWLAGLPAVTPGQGQPSITQRRLVVRWHQRTIVRVLALQRKYDQAVTQAQDYIKIDPKHTQLMSLLASCYEQIGRDGEAMAVIEAALKIEPDDPTLNNNLGYMFANRGIHLKRAEQLVRRALAMTEDPGSAVAYLDSLAWVIYKQGRIAEAARLMQTALRRIRSEALDHPVIRDHAGDIFYRQSNTTAALDQWTRALEGAKKDTPPVDRELRNILKTVPGKIEAAKAGKNVNVAPLGKDVTPVKVLPKPAQPPADDDDLGF